MKRYELLRALVAATAPAAEGGQPLLDNNEIIAAEHPVGQPRARLVDISATLAKLGEKLGKVEATDDVVAVLQEISDAKTAVDAELAATPDAAAVAASLVAAITKNPGPASDLTAASTATPARPPLGAVRAPRDRRPAGARHTAPRAQAVLASAAGESPIESLQTLAERLHQGARNLQQDRGNRGARVLVAALQTTFPEDRMLGRDPAVNDARLEQVLGVAPLTASGGVCGPVTVDYNIPTFATQERPLRDGLPGFGADRGGVTFSPPPLLTDLAGGTVVWTEANDASPSAPATKPVATVTCPDVETVLVDAIPTRIRIGNFLSRFNPEQHAAQVETALAHAARVAELNLLAAIDAKSTEVLSTAYLGAARDLLATIDLTCAALRDRQRVPRAKMMRVVLPEFSRDMLRADLARQLGTDSSEQQGGALAVTDEQIDAWLAVRGVRAIWTLDGRPAGGGSGRTYPAQSFAAQAAGALVGWPAKVVFSVFPEGSFVFLDGGELDLGMVRDSTLNNTNDAELFVEPFEQVAFRGVEALKVVAPVAPNGGSAGTIATSTYTAGA